MQRIFNMFIKFELYNKQWGSNDILFKYNFRWVQLSLCKLKMNNNKFPILIVK